MNATTNLTETCTHLAILCSVSAVLGFLWLTFKSLSNFSGYPNNLIYAPAIRRLGAHCIDWLVVNTIGAIVLSVFCLNLSLFPDFWQLAHVSNALPAMPFFGFSLEYMAHAPLGSYYSLASIKFIVWSLLLIECSYFVFSESSEKQATFGKQFFKIQVVDYQGERLTVEKALLRYACKGLGTVLLYAVPPGPTVYSACLALTALAVALIDPALITLTPKAQGLHDLLAKTVCIRKPESEAKTL